LLEARRARHERKKQAKLARVDRYIPNVFLVRELTVVRVDFDKEKSVPIISPFVRIRVGCH
jgi:hypothetical protein